VNPVNPGCRGIGIILTDEAMHPEAFRLTEIASIRNQPEVDDVASSTVKNGISMYQNPPKQAARTSGKAYKIFKS